MENYNFLVSIAIIMLTTKILGDLTNKFNLTQVVGALLAGVVVGPSCLGLIAETDFISCTAESLKTVVASDPLSKNRHLRRG